jgi:hypothetical protein
MSVTLSVELQPFTVPNFVREKTRPRPRQDGFHETPCHALHELDQATLSQMCDEFRAGVFAKAMKKDPAQSNKS